MKVKVIVFGQEMKRCTSDISQCGGFACASDSSVICAHRFDFKLAEIAINRAKLLADKILNAELRRRPLGSEHIDAAKTIIEIKEQFDKANK